jgi:serine/threonine protein phosphatase PrpC
MTTTITFKKKYPHLIKPVNKGNIHRILKDISQLQSEIFEYHETSIIPSADASSIIGKRFEMEDTYKITKLSNGAEFYGVFDGHGGWEISALINDVLAKKFEVNLQANKTFDHTNINAVTELIRTVCLDLGKEIFELTNCRTIGSTAVFALRFGQYLYLANIGDSTGIIIRSPAGDDQSNLLLKTKNHKPYDKKERIRIEKRGAYVFDGRVNGQLAVSRSFGDNYYNIKHQKTYSGFETVVTHEPDIYSFIIPEPNTTSDTNISQTDYYLILGSDGLWDNCLFENIASDLELDSESNSEDDPNSEQIYSNKFTFKQLADIVISKSSRQASIEIVKLAYHTGIYDNITALVVKLTDKSSSAETSAEPIEMEHDDDNDDTQPIEVECDNIQPTNEKCDNVQSNDTDCDNTQPIEVECDNIQPTNEKCDNVQSNDTDCNNTTN